MKPVKSLWRALAARRSESLCPAEGKEAKAKDGQQTRDTDSRWKKKRFLAARGGIWTRRLFSPCSRFVFSNGLPFCFHNLSGGN
jgi:hypothetical protein